MPEDNSVFFEFFDEFYTEIIQNISNNVARQIHIFTQSECAFY